MGGYSHSGGPQRSDFSAKNEGRGGTSYLRPEEITGIAVLVLILVALLIIGCWFYRRRNGYIMIKTRGPVGSIRKALRAGRGNEDLFENKVPLNDYGNFGPVVPNAPPAYEKIQEQLPPPYTP
ncbi:melanoma antigen recognized by T-cells 1 [Erpetoichthys calabaricus]|uniref:Melan-A n=1 Tax=Erpetoichthys calabaricus TaxID=27687 RepID=A0A8C4X7E4_ERPCA|nr:melanoma antigen recognized by T-cells 1 [Erpetoichthys calabaricus]